MSQCMQLTSLRMMSLYVRVRLRCRTRQSTVLKAFFRLKEDIGVGGGDEVTSGVTSACVLCCVYREQRQQKLSQTT